MATGDAEPAKLRRRSATPVLGLSTLRDAQDLPEWLVEEWCPNRLFALIAPKLCRESAVIGWVLNPGRDGSRARPPQRERRHPQWVPHVRP